MPSPMMYWDADGLLHREDGPAYIDGNDLQYFCIHGKFHRLDGPAYIGPYSSRWYINDNLIDVLEYEKWLDEMNIDLENLSEEDKSLIMMKWA